MTWLEWVGAASIAIFVPLGMAVVFVLFIQWWVERKDVRKAVLGYYYEKLKREYQERKRGWGA